MGGAPHQFGRKWTAVLCAVVCIHLLVSLFVPRGFALATFGDITQCVLLLAATLAVLSNVATTHRKSRFFWGLMSLGCTMWLAAQVLWTYFEVLRHRDVPVPFSGDVIFFLHIVPLMAAVAVQPHLRHEARTAHSDSLDFVLLLTWWLYLYLYIVIPWQYVYPRESIYGVSFDALYAFEQLAWIAALIVVWRGAPGAWRNIYRNLLCAASVYSVGSILASEAIDRHIYYTGSLFDIPLIAAMAWFVAIGLMARRVSSASIFEEVPARGHGLWKARLAMFSVFLTPLMVAWAQFGGHAPQRVRTYRLLLTVAVMIVMGALVFVKQHLLNQELLNLLRLSHQNLNEVSQLKDELESKEHSLRWHSLELQRKNLELQEISFTDSLTGTWNRRYLEEIITAEAGQVLRNYQRARGTDIRKIDHRDLVFIMVDMDFFKEVNDQYGHPAGDRLLQLVAERLSTVVRKSDVLVRWGGEEFLIMNRSTDPSGTPAFCSRILQVMASTPFDLGQGIVVRKTCSVGWAPYPWCRVAYEALCAEEVIALADAALYQAKGSGRNRSVGIISSDAASAAPGEIRLAALQQPGSALTHVIRTECPAVAHPENIHHPAESVEKPQL